MPTGASSGEDDPTSHSTCEDPVSTDDTDTTTGAGQGTDAPPPPPPPPGPQVQPPLRRRDDDKIVAGVASGLAAYLRVDPALVRIGFVVLLFMGGIGIPLYLAGWLLIPAADEAETQAAQLIDQRGPAFWVGVGLLVLVAFAVADEVVFAGRTNWWPLVFIAAGVALWRVGQRDGERRAVTGPPPPPGAASSAAAPPSDPPSSTPHQERAMSSTTPVREYTPPPAPDRRRPDPVAYSPPPAPPTERSALGRITVALALIAAGITVLLDRATTVIDAGLPEVLAVVLVTIGAGLVVGTWFGRARWLILVGLLLAPIVVVTSLASSWDIAIGDGIGDRTYAIRSAADIPDGPIDLGIGSLRLDLSEFSSELATAPVVAEVGAGEIVVTVPAGAAVSVDAEVGVGEIVIFGDRTEGPDLSASFDRTGDGPTLELDLEVGAGSIRVREASGSAALPAATTTALATTTEVQR
jgi:phage shock protein PspC (stress-responsive transcriptional regulator)